MLFKLSNLNLNLALTFGYLNQLWTTRSCCLSMLNLFKRCQLAAKEENVGLYPKHLILTELNSYRRMHAQLINLVLCLLLWHHNFKSDFLICFQLTFFAKCFLNSFVGAKTNFLRLIFLLQRLKQYLPSPGAASDPFAEFLSEQR